MPAKFRKLKDANTSYTPTMYPDGVLQFRHPWMVDKKGYGRLIRLGYAKLNDGARGEVLGQARTLCTVAPRHLKDLPLDIKFNEKLIGAYWEGMFHTGYESEFDQYLDVIDKDAEGLEYIKVPKALFESLEMKSQNIDRLMNENATLQNTIESLTKSVGHRSDMEKALTLQAGFEHWKAHLKVNSKSLQVRDDYFRRVSYLVEALKPDTLLHTITKNQILDAVKANAENEYAKRMKAVKRFFADLCKLPNEDGLGLTFNPAKSIPVKNSGTIARGQDKDILAPFKMLENKKLSTYWKAVIGCCSFGGMRLSEALSLTWENIDFKKQIIGIKPTEIKPGLKTENSKRPVKPFENLWDILKAHRDTQPVGTKLVFPTDELETGCWFKLHKNAITCYGSGGLIGAMQEAGIKELQPARRMRRWCSTMFEVHGMGAVEEIMMGHSDKVARDHYQDSLVIVEKQKMPKLA